MGSTLLGDYKEFNFLDNWIFPFRLSWNDGNREYCASCARPHVSCTGRNVSRYVPFWGLWDSQYQKVRNTVAYHYSLNPGPDSDPGPAFW